LEKKYLLLSRQLRREITIEIDDESNYIEVVERSPSRLLDGSIYCYKDQQLRIYTYSFLSKLLIFIEWKLDRSLDTVWIDKSYTE
jgi:hypothetical protein